jgi:3-deoxy-D-manno-octulosonate 8-phosphate phosphatase (KDO 8-P phosphatase)
MNKHAIQKAKNIKAFIFDIDGVLTDGKIILDDNGVETKSFDIKDGFALWNIKEMGFVRAIITGGKASVVENRAKQLKIDYLFLGALDKLTAYNDFKQQSGFEDYQIAYMGDDLIDLPIITRCGLATCPNDAVDEVKKRVDIVMNAKGGNGAVRELIEIVLKSQDIYDSWIKRYDI